MFEKDNNCDVAMSANSEGAVDGVMFMQIFADVPEIGVLVRSAALFEVNVLGRHLIMALWVMFGETFL